MKPHSIAGAAVIALVLSTGLALAQTPAAAATAQYGQGSLPNSGYVGDGASPGFLSHGGGGPNG